MKQVLMTELYFCYFFLTKSTMQHFIKPKPFPCKFDLTVLPRTHTHPHIHLQVCFHKTMTEALNCSRLDRFSWMVVPCDAKLCSCGPHCRFVRIGNMLPVRCKNVFLIFLVDRDYLIISIDRYHFL